MRNIDIESITLQDLLTVDTHGEIINIKDKRANRTHELIPDRTTFFNKNGLFANVEDNGITIIKSSGNSRINLDEFLDSLDRKKESAIVLIEGFAGCGKSTLVQYILSKQLETYNYDYSLFNYDLEAQNDIYIHDKNGDVVYKSSIFEAIKKSFCEQFIKQKYNVINDFNEMLKKCEQFQKFNQLYHDFYNTDTYDEIKYNLSKNNCQKNIIARNVIKQLKEISSSSCLLALDCILRLAMYKNNLIDKLYICYDNLDSIEDADDLMSFDDNLASFRSVLDSFINYLEKESYFENMVTPHFVILATYRKITASLANIATTAFKEVSIDKNIGVGRESVIHLDATSAFSYSKIVEKRRNYFYTYFNSITNFNAELKNKLLDSFESWNKLNQNLEIMNDRYACLWNKNYRTCSLIANELYTNPDYDFSNCVDFIKSSKIHDGYQSKTDDKGDSILCTYFGSSAILLSNVCKVFNTNHIWDDFLDLAPLNQKNTSYKNVSFSRIILTYIYNKNNETSLDELYNMFCRNDLFDYNKMCKILSKMLARNLDGVWRRPIYYSGKCILSEKDKDIQAILLEECRKIKEGEITTSEYSFLLCDSGKSYVEQLMQEFEFFSNRLSNKNKALYLYQNSNDIDCIIKSVYDAVSCCCDNMIEFSKKFIETAEITKDDYLALPIHPRTNNSHTFQLHTERTIFSHIAYLNNVRLYFCDKVINPDLSTRKNYNNMFINHIKNYLDLYFEKIVPLTDQRKKVAEDLYSIIEEIDDSIACNNNSEMIFKSISL